jgi:hypothetical protein
MRTKFFLFLWLASLSALPAQEFAPIYTNLDRLESLMKESQSLIGSMESDNENLKAALTNLDGLLRTQGELLAGQQKAWEEQQAISARQSELLGKSIAKSKRLTISLMVAVPVVLAAGTGLGIWLVRK